MEMEKRKVSDSIVETVHMVRPQHLNASDLTVCSEGHLCSGSMKWQVWWQNATQGEM